jgi:formate dehydrogenase alpha subunit
MVLQTATPRLVNHRRNIIRLMIAEHPESCIVCSKGNRCRLRQVAADLGIGETGFYPMPNFKPLEQANPFIIRDLSKCILCGKCIRADHELVVVGAIDYNLRGFGSRPATAHELGLEHSSCTFCGTCVSMCPTGALATNNSHYVGSPQRESLSICGYCAIGCRLAMGAANDRVVEVNPANLPDSVNGATLCVRGHFAHDYLNSAERLVSPLVRKNGDRGEAGQIPLSWEEALALVARRLAEIKNENGPQSIAFYGSSKCSNEENYLFQKLARVLIGTNHLDNGGYLSGLAQLKLLDEKTDRGWRIYPLADMQKTEAILILGADPNHSAPVVSYHLKRAANRGIPLIVVDPRKTELVKFASIWLRPRPATDLDLLNALAALLHEKKSYDHAYLEKYTEGFSIFRYSLSALDLDRVCRVTGLELPDLHKTAALLHNKKMTIVIGHGILQQRNAMHRLGAIFNLALLTGSLGSEGAGLCVLARENNQIGAMDMGMAPELLPGRELLTDGSVRKSWERIWKTRLSPDPGLTIVRMVEAAEKGQLKAMYILGENPLLALPQPERVRQALAKLEFIVVQDILNTATSRMADVVLAGAAFSEKSGSFTNLESRIQSFHAVVPPPGIAKPDWEILDRLSATIANIDAYGSLEKIRMEIRQRIPGYAELNGEGTAWIKSTSRKTLFKIPGAKGLISFYPVVATQDSGVDDDYPLTAILGSLRYHLGSGTRTGVSERIQAFGVCGEIQVSPEDGQRLDLREGDCIRVISPFGMVTRAVGLKREISPGQLFVPLAVHSNDAMNLIGLNDLSAPESTGWKTVKVRLEKV